MKNTKVNDQISRKQHILAGSPEPFHIVSLVEMRNDKLQFTLLVWIAIVSSALAQPLPHRPVDYVNPLIGTAPFEDAEYLGNNPPKGEELYYGSEQALLVVRNVEGWSDTPGLIHSVRVSNWRIRGLHDFRSGGRSRQGGHLLCRFGHSEEKPNRGNSRMGFRPNPQTNGRRLE